MTDRTRALRVAVAWGAAAIAAMPAAAQDPATGPTDLAAEHHRLQGELVALADRGAWQGVERGYRAMVDQRMALTDLDHLLGGRAALAQRDPLLAAQRLRRIRTDAPAADAETEALRAKAQETLGGVLTQYGLASIVVAEGRQALLVRPEAPFGSDEQAAIERARSELAIQRAWHGLLPVGSYEVDGEPLEVRPGTRWNTVVVR